MQRRDAEFIVSADELSVLRQALFLVKHHLDPAFSENLHTLTGIGSETFERLLSDIDALRSERGIE